VKAPSPEGSDAGDVELEPSGGVAIWTDWRGFMRFVILIAIVFVHIAAFLLMAARHRSLERPQIGPETTLILLKLPSAAGQPDPAAPTVKARPAPRSEHIARDKILQSPKPSCDALGTSPAMQ
jgi:hypothetical protein